MLSNVASEELQGIIDDMLMRADADLVQSLPKSLKKLSLGDHGTLARVITALELCKPQAKCRKEMAQWATTRGQGPVSGLTRNGGHA